MKKNKLSPNSGLKKQVRIPFQANTSLEEALKRITLPVKTVDDIRAGLNEGRLEHVRKKGEDRV